MEVLGTLGIILFIFWNYVGGQTTTTNVTFVQTTDSSSSSPTEINIRLVNGDSEMSGRVEVQNKAGGPWGTVCDDREWDNAASTVVCRQLGYVWGVSFRLAKFGPGPESSPILLDDLSCSGTEASLLDCRHEPWGDSDCSHSEDAGVVCYNASVRLSSPTPDTPYGAVQVENNYLWVDVCHDNWTQTAAKLVCQALGYVDGFGRGFSWLAAFSAFNTAFSFTYNCSDIDTSLADCTRTLATRPCQTSSKAIAVCSNTNVTSLDMATSSRLSETNSSWGTVEVRHISVWGRVCSDQFWTNASATVFCKELGKGFVGGVPFASSGDVKPPYWYHELNCDGSEDSLFTCAKGSLYSPNSQACKSARALCYTGEGVSFSLVGGPHPRKGQVQITYEGTPGFICGDSLKKHTAQVICRQLGYSDGDVVDSVAPAGTIYLGNIACGGAESSILECPNSGWKVEPEGCSGNGAVICYKQLRLWGGTVASGIVEMFENGRWVALCEKGFTDEHARLVCKEFGHNNGSALPVGSYGTYYQRLTRPYLNCSNSSQSILDCDYDRQATCSGSGFHYASVSCYDGALPDELEFKIQGETPSASYGHLVVKKQGLWGEICEAGWGDNEATVACKVQGFQGGVSMLYPAGYDVPTLVASVTCQGNETSLSNCSIRSDFVCSTPYRAGILCYRESAPSFHLVGGGENYGLVEIEVDGERGTICDINLTTDDASTICRSLGRNFTSGEPYSGFEKATVDVVLSGLSCRGYESSLLTCKHNGWKEVKQDYCLEHRYDVGVYCYGKVRVLGGQRSNDYLTGRVEVIAVSGQIDWISICGDLFDQTDADVVCREVGFDKALVLAPGSFGLRSKWKYYTNMTCAPGGNSVHDNCTFDTGICRQTAHNYASVMCMKDGLKPETKVYIENGSTGTVIMERYGMNGTICDHGWDDTDASMLCRQKGYKGGVVLGVPEIYSRSRPIWFTNYSCSDSDVDFDNCSRSTVVPMWCSTSLKTAGVLCYQSTGVEVRLGNLRNLGYRSRGRVEISVDGVWGTICNYEWSTYDARVICRQLGFPDGLRDDSATIDDLAEGPVYLSGLTCDSTETSILACPNLGWNVTQTSCADHLLDATVACKPNVMTSFGLSYGPVSVYDSGSYAHVCSEGFDEVDARAVCYSMGFSTGTSICCSAFGDTQIPIIFSNPRCEDRQDVDFMTCPKDYGYQTCPSRQYASVVCAKTEPPIGFGVGLWERNETKGMGPVMIDYFLHKGYICAEEFTDADANVVCRELSYKGGIAYKQHSDGVIYRYSKEIHWLRAPGCIGNETSLRQCAGIQISNISGGCSVYTHAAVACYNSTETAGFDIQLINSPHHGEGYVQIKINGTWGSVCSSQVRLGDAEAAVICRHLRFRSGIPLLVSSYDRPTGHVWVDNLSCTGDESSILECGVSGIGGTISSLCARHTHDVAVSCNANVRVSASSSPRYGMVQLYNETVAQWVSVCDTDFDDVDAAVFCRTMGYKSGKAQCCSALGLGLERFNPIRVAQVDCHGNEDRFTDCNMVLGDVSCPSGKYAAAICTDENPPVEGLKVSLSEGLFYGHLEVERYGVIGSVCDLDWDDLDATVVCRSLGFTVGYATNGTYRAVQPMLMASVDCNGTESTLSQCRIAPFKEGHPCNGRMTRAAVVCAMENDTLRYRLAAEDNGVGRAEIYFNGQWGTICSEDWNDVDASVFCREAGYVTGFTTRMIEIGSLQSPIWMTNVGCTGNETRFFQCQASWNVKTSSSCSHYNDAGVSCLKSVRLQRGDKRSNGIVSIYDPERGLFDSWRTLCASSFTEKEADLVCRILGHERGVPVCCSPYGYSSILIAEYSPRCNGTERHITDCQKVQNVPQCSRRSYASVVCYNGSRPVEDYSLTLSGSIEYTGQVEVTYLNVPGRICWDDWDDQDARVVCRELGYSNGMAYYHYKSSFIYLDYNGPYWTSKVNCTGNETRFGDCPHVGFGNVTECNGRGHYAGVVCFDESGLSYRISGGNDRFGRVEFSYHNEWHSLCSSTWDPREAQVMCRQLGYTTGDTYTGEYLSKPEGDAWSVQFRCTGNETSLNKCAHEGLSEAQHCDGHKEGVFCYTSVKLSGKEGTNSNNGTVLYYHDDQWKLVCDDGFDDVTARRVCQELGFADGRAICCSAFGAVFEDMLINNTLQCNGDEQKIEDCLQEKKCNSSHYASAVCFKPDVTIEEDVYTFAIDGSNKGQIKVNHFGVEGRICSRSWDDNEAQIICRQNGFQNGLSYQHSESNVLQEVRGPYWLSGFNCTGSESSLLDCAYNSRLDLGNCTGYHIASVLCYNETGVQYRMRDGGDHYGRVEIAIGGTWGTICDQYWDYREAKVFCRQMNFTDGEAMRSAHFGKGTGPIWLSHLECKGTENRLHQCPHRGFSNDFSFGWWFPLPCETHSDDAGVFCYRSVRLNRGPKTHAGGVEMYHEGSWYGICDTNFDRNAALVACHSVRDGYVDARPIPGSVYGNITGEIMFSSVQCSGDEKDLKDCQYEFNTTCPSNTYVSVYCSNTTINETESSFALRLASDSLSSGAYGILEARINGIWGRVCLHSFDDKDATVACRQLGYDGGVAYLHIMKNDRPILVWDLECNGTEDSLENCMSPDRRPDLVNCPYGANDAGVICYETQNVGFQYRLTDGGNDTYGRVEIGYNGVWGIVCAWSWQSADARVLCKKLGFADGVVRYNKTPIRTRQWVSGFFCQGNEPSPMTCLNTGFNSSFLSDLCTYNKMAGESGAYSECFENEVVPTEIRLVNGPDKYSGRVEVYVSGPNQWGTICDDYWEDAEAVVVCRQLGYYGGAALRRAAFGQGEGPIWFDNMGCNSTESSLFDCNHRGIGTHNCGHSEDVGVICISPDKTTMTKAITTTTSTTTKKTTTTKSTTTTTTKTTTTTTKTTTVKTPAPTSKTTKPTSPSTSPSKTTTKSTAKPTTARSTSPSTQTTTSSPTKPSTMSSRKPTSETTSSGQNQTEAPVSHTASAGTNATVIVVPIVIVLLLIVLIIVAIVIFKYRRDRIPRFTRQQFDEAIITEDLDGSVSAENQLYDLDLQPSPVSNGFREPSAASGDKMTFSKNGNAYYMKSASNGNGLDANAFTNPLYEANSDIIGQPGDVGGDAAMLPVVSQTGFPVDEAKVQGSDA